MPVVTTPLSIMKELPVTDNEHIELNWDCSNADEVARQIFEKEVKPFKYKIPEDNWRNLLANIKSSYEEEKKMKYIVQATNKYKQCNIFDKELSIEKGMPAYIPEEGETWEVDFTRKEELVEKGFAIVVKEIKKEKEIETAKKEVKTEKAVKKSTKKAK